MDSKCMSDLSCGPHRHSHFKDQLILTLHLQYSLQYSLCISTVKLGILYSY
eukprot:SAG31_NODE_1113_length_9854_cov_2.770682_3_plen_51_part_00